MALISSSSSTVIWPETEYSSSIWRMSIANTPEIVG
jgi:hypothetical protein